MNIAKPPTGKEAITPIRTSNKENVVKAVYYDNKSKGSRPISPRRLITREHKRNLADISMDNENKKQYLR